jgi:membrane fusion protein (multidrug efflux system)
VEVSRVATVRLQDDAQAVGTLRSRQSVVLKPEFSGRVAHIAFADGANVRQGQLLVQLDDTLQRAELSQAQAQLSIAKANLNRNKELVAENFVAQRVVEESEANLQVAQAQVALADARLKRMRITAPFSGTVGLSGTNLGAYVKDGDALVNGRERGHLLPIEDRHHARLPGRLRVVPHPGEVGRAVGTARDAVGRRPLRVGGGVVGSAARGDQPGERQRGHRQERAPGPSPAGARVEL